MLLLLIRKKFLLKQNDIDVLLYKALLKDKVIKDQIYKKKSCGL